MYLAQQFVFTVSHMLNFGLHIQSMFPLSPLDLSNTCLDCRGDGVYWFPSKDILAVERLKSRGVVDRLDMRSLVSNRQPSTTRVSQQVEASGTRWFRSIIMSPTRQLSDQLFRVLKSVGKHYGFSAGLLIVVFENVNIIHHLHCGGVLEAICISCATYHTNKSFTAFVKRFGLLVLEVLCANHDRNDACREILNKAGIRAYQVFLNLY
ncbi:hypothetical protein SSX86_006214 [Deinandra increscens subsp. villosa]|uniref:Uncharacterized protein n=1 Tax=Deinandra increscens subsp. villosa TaxID=3103831 RepID=A0AAP0DMM7_9ASTR